MVSNAVMVDLPNVIPSSWCFQLSLGDSKDHRQIALGEL